MLVFVEVAVLVAAASSFFACEAVVPSCFTVGSLVTVSLMPETAIFPGLLAFAIQNASEDLIRHPASVSRGMPPVSLQLGHARLWNAPGIPFTPVAPLRYPSGEGSTRNFCSDRTVITWYILVYRASRKHCERAPISHYSPHRSTLLLQCRQ